MNEWINEFRFRGSEATVNICIEVSVKRTRLVASDDCHCPAYLATDCQHGLRRRSSSAAFFQSKERRVSSDGPKVDMETDVLLLQVRVCGTSFQLVCLRYIDINFLLLARYVPNVAKRSIWEWDQCNIEDRPTDRPTTDLCSWKSLPGRTSNGHISITVLARHMVTTDHP